MAMILKYADSILRGFASAAALIIATVASHFALGNVIPPALAAGSTVVVCAGLIYSDQLTGVLTCLNRTESRRVVLSDVGGKQDPVGDADTQAALLGHVHAQEPVGASDGSSHITDGENKWQADLSPKHERV